MLHVLKMHTHTQHYAHSQARSHNRGDCHQRYGQLVTTTLNTTVNSLNDNGL